MMVEIQEILTELVNYAIERYASFPVTPLPSDELTDTAIANATEQIRQQQRERVESLITFLRTIANTTAVLQDAERSQELLAQIHDDITEKLGEPEAE